MMRDCDTLLVVGSSFPYAEFLPEEGQARGVQIDVDARMIGLRYPMEVNLIGDSRDALLALLQQIAPKPRTAWREGIEDNVRRWWEVMEARAHDPADPINPQLVIHELSARLPDHAIVTWDSGSGTDWFARHVRLRAGMMASGSGTLASMGSAVPYAIAAKFAHPDRTVVAIAGDGAMQMNGTSELLTIARYRERWADQQLVVVVLNNRDLNQVTWEQRVLAGDPKFEGSQTLPDGHYAKAAELYGLRGIRVERPEDVGPAWDEALKADRPVVLDVLVDPEVPPLPPHVTTEQAKAILSAIVQGDPGARRLIAATLRDKAAEVLPRR
jgi:pyruvate dehydrogenase (quinone)